MDDFLKYEYYKTQDFVWDDRFRSWVLEAKAEDTVYWTQFVIQFPDKEREIDLAREIILRMKVPGPTLSTIQAQELVSTVMEKIGDDSLPARSIYRRLKAPLYVAVALVFISAVLMGLPNLLRVSDGVPYAEEISQSDADGWMGTGASQSIERTNTSNRSLEIKLADGSDIVLEPGSSIRYASSFASNEFREIHLTGKAFFDVKRDTARPFLVYANGTVTKVLGTSFWIYAPKDIKEQATVEVVSGVVTVYPMGSKKPNEIITKSKVGEVILTRNQKAEYSKDRNRLVTTLVDNPVAIDTKLETNKFIDYPILEIVEALGTEYGIEIIHDDKLLANRTLTADLSGLTMYQKLDVICKTINAHYEVINGKVIIL
ncbi:FecR family protein [Parapedobacter soli]|uniref:FecR family protein n=1 Tax=Parapedobacter soli TaxID=416955 RepID=UPI0021C82D47|nr:FecR family protein [Parapedobacter soli]